MEIKSNWDEVVAQEWQKAKLTQLWGTYGKNGNEPLRYVRLVDCSTDHLRAILKQPHIDAPQLLIVKGVIRLILKERGISVDTQHPQC